MNIVITAWALDSYLDIKHAHVFIDQEYKGTIRPDVMLLQTFPTDVKFQNSKFWSIATDGKGSKISDGFKVKWHQIGPGKVQMRLPVGMFAESYLCEAYVKTDPKKEKRMMAKFKTHLELIRRGQFTECGRLS